MVEACELCELVSKAQLFDADNSKKKTPMSYGLNDYLIKANNILKDCLAVLRCQNNLLTKDILNYHWFIHSLIMQTFIPLMLVEDIKTLDVVPF